MHLQPIDVKRDGNSVPRFMLRWPLGNGANVPPEVFCGGPSPTAVDVGGVRYRPGTGGEQHGPPGTCGQRWLNSPVTEVGHWRGRPRQKESATSRLSRRCDDVILAPTRPAEPHPGDKTMAVPPSTEIFLRLPA